MIIIVCWASSYRCSLRNRHGTFRTPSTKAGTIPPRNIGQGRQFSYPTRSGLALPYARVDKSLPYPTRGYPLPDGHTIFNSSIIIFRYNTFRRVSSTLFLFVLQLASRNIELKILGPGIFAINIRLITSKNTRIAGVFHRENK